MAKKVASQIVMDIFLKEPVDVCEQLLGVAKAALKSRKGVTRPVVRAARKQASVPDAPPLGDL